jgi:hypothetical protein
MRKAASAAVADVLDDRRQRRVRPGRKRQPALHRVTAEPGERDVEDLHVLQMGLDGFEAGVQTVLARLLQRLAPEGVEVLRLDGRAAIVPELIERKVEQGHGRPPLLRIRVRMITPYGGGRRAARPPPRAGPSWLR